METTNTTITGTKINGKTYMTAKEYSDKFNVPLRTVYWKIEHDKFTTISFINRKLILID